MRQLLLRHATVSNAGRSRPPVQVEDNMTVVNRTKTLIFAALALCVVSSVGHTQQWNGPANPNGTIWRPGNVVLGGEPSRGDDPKAVLDVKLPPDKLDDLIFRLSYSYQGSSSSRFEVDRHRAYAGGARSKADFLPGDYDFAVHRSAAIGVTNMNEDIPSGYALAVGGKILAEEVKIRLLKDWADYVFDDNYQLRSLAEVEDFIHANHRLPEIPSAAQVGTTGVSLGEMQSKLLRKVEELTLYLIEQNKAIETLHRKLAHLGQKNELLKSTPRR
jgi:hypothetical protein